MLLLKSELEWDSRAEDATWDSFKKDGDGFERTKELERTEVEGKEDPGNAEGPDAEIPTTPAETGSGFRERSVATSTIG